MACDMIESCITRTDTTFQQWLKKGTGFISTDYVLPTEMCVMINIILDAKNQSFKLCAVDGVDVVSHKFLISYLKLFFLAFSLGPSLQESIYPRYKRLPPAWICNKATGFENYLKGWVHYYQSPSCYLS